MNPSQQQQQNYRQLGFNIFMERQPSTYLANDQLNQMVSPFIADVDENGFLFSPFTDFSQISQSQQQPTSASDIQGGALNSSQGGMSIDLTQGNINFTNGVTNTTIDANGTTTSPAQPSTPGAPTG